MRTCIAVLRAIEADRSQLTQLSQEQRRELLTLAGLVAQAGTPRPGENGQGPSVERTRAAARERDEQIIQRTGLRIQRRATRYTPLWLPEPGGADIPEAAPTLGKPLNCYVCKQPFTL